MSYTKIAYILIFLFILTILLLLTYILLLYNILYRNQPALGYLTLLTSLTALVIILTVLITCYFFILDYIEKKYHIYTPLEN